MKGAIGEVLVARYEDDEVRTVSIEPCVNHEIVLTIDGAPPVFLDALDLLRAVSEVALNAVYGPSPTDQPPDDPLALAALQHRQRGRQDGSWGCACGWDQDKPHREHVAEMAALASAANGAAQ